MDHPVNLTVVLLYLLISSFQRLSVSGIGRNVARCRANRRQTIQLRLDLRVLHPSPDPHDPCLMGADHVFAPCFADATSTADHHINTAILVQAALCTRRAARQQLLAIPLTVAIAPAIPLLVSR